MQVEVSGRTFEFPPYCACCGSPANTTLPAAATRTHGKKVVRTETQVWDFPYCTQCTAHVQAVHTASYRAKTIAICTFLLGCYFAYAIWLPLGVFTVVAGIGGAIYAHAAMMNQARRLSVPQCACLDTAVHFLGWDGTRQVFYFRSHAYATVFMMANRAKLVNLSFEAQQLLQAQGVTPTNRTQGSRRYKS